MSRTKVVGPHTYSPARVRTAAQPACVEPGLVPRATITCNFPSALRVSSRALRENRVLVARHTQNHCRRVEREVLEQRAHRGHADTAGDQDRASTALSVGGERSVRPSITTRVPGFKGRELCGVVTAVLDRQS